MVSVGWKLNFAPQQLWAISKYPHIVLVVVLMECEVPSAVERYGKYEAFWSDIRVAVSVWKGSLVVRVIKGQNHVVSQLLFSKAAPRPKHLTNIRTSSRQKHKKNQIPAFVFPQFVSTCRVRTPFLQTSTCE